MPRFKKKKVGPIPPPIDYNKWRDNLKDYRDDHLERLKYEKIIKDAEDKK